MDSLSLLSLSFPTPAPTHRMSHFRLLSKSLCIIKMLPGNTPAVDIQFSVYDNVDMSEFSQNKKEKEGGGHLVSYWMKTIWLFAKRTF